MNRALQILCKWASENGLGINPEKTELIMFTRETKPQGLKAFYACKSAIGKSWGLSPRIIIWIYSAIIRPILTHGSIVWWQSLRVDTIHKMLTKIQRQVCNAAIGALRTTPSEALFALLNLPSLKDFIFYSASKTALRLLSNFHHYIAWLNTSLRSIF